MTTEDAELTADTLVAADLRGVMSHGMVRLPVYRRNLRDGTVSPTAQPLVVSDSPSTALFDGQNAMGQVVGVRAMDLAIEKARSSGVASVGARHSNHFGTCAYYALRAAQHDMIGIAMTNGAAAMAPWGAIEPLVGNNPLAVAAPAGPSPIVLDMAMTVVARGKIRLAQLRGEPLPARLGFRQARASEPGRGRGAERLAGAGRRLQRLRPGRRGRPADRGADRRGAVAGAREHGLHCECRRAKRWRAVRNRRARAPATGSWRSILRRFCRSTSSSGARPGMQRCCTRRRAPRERPRSTCPVSPSWRPNVIGWRTASHTRSRSSRSCDRLRPTPA